MGMEGFPPMPRDEQKKEDESIPERTDEIIKEEELSEIRTQLNQARTGEKMMNPESLSDSELEQFGIKKSFGKDGETIFDYGHNEETGMDMMGMMTQVSTKKVRFESAAEEEAFFAEVERKRLEDEEKRKTEEVGTLPGRGELMDEELVEDNGEDVSNEGQVN